MKPTVYELLDELREQLKTQDNLATSSPIFVVQQRRRVYGFDPNYGTEDITVWLDSTGDYTEADPEEHARLEAEYESTGEEPDGWTRTCYQDTWEYVQPFFTRKAAEGYIQENRHNLRDPRVYVESGYRNHEWEFLRELLIAGVMPESDYTSLEARHRSTVDEVPVQVSIHRYEDSVGDRGPGWYWWETECPEEGSNGPYEKLAEAVEHIVEAHCVPEEASLKYLAELLDKQPAAQSETSG